MQVGLLQLRILVPDAMSLKDKRRAVKSLKDRIAHRFNVSVAEVGLLDSLRQSELGVALVTNDATFAESCLSKIVNLVRATVKLELLDYYIEVI
jgi:uncharacterized protein YlxP (DUF503 family)